MKKIYLEFLRGISSVFILGWHLIFLAPTGHPTRFAGYWGTDALMLFFMLSGLVINMSQSTKPKTTIPFLTNRFIRIYPQFLIGILLAFIALYITNTTFPSIKTTIGNLFLVSTMNDYMGYIVPSIQSNLAVWSLSFEVAFYVLFAFTIGRYQKKALICWFMISLIAIPLHFLRSDRDVFTHAIAIFSFSSIWLVGYYIYEYRHLIYTDKYVVLFSLGVLPLISRMHFSANFYDPFRYFIFAIFAIPFFRYCLQLPPAGKKIKIIYVVIPHILIVFAALTIRYLPLKNAIAYSTLPYVYIGLGYLADVLKINARLKDFINKSGAIMGKYSYSLYISHFPIVFIFSKLMHNIWGYVFFCLPVVFVVAYSLETWLQPAVVKYFRKAKAMVPATESTAGNYPETISPYLFPAGRPEIIA